jgi:hypothetical protein
MREISATRRGTRKRKGNGGGRNQRKGRGMSEVEASTCRLGEAATVAGRWREGEEVVLDFLRMGGSFSV